LDRESIGLLKGFLEKADQKLRAAEELLKVAAYEDVVSRAYYCAFHAAQAVLLVEGLSARTHQGVVNLFGLHIVKTGMMDKKFGKMLNHLKDDRETGDYAVLSFIDEETAENALKEAEEFLNEAKRYLARYL
jgi:uncharacterized protein (UPF0332 family)